MKTLSQTRNTELLSPKHKPIRSAGQSVVELALMLPILILILVGVLDLGRAFGAQVTLTNAAREGARYAIDNSNITDEPAIKTRIDTEAKAGGIVLDLTNKVQIQGLGSSVSGNPVTVTVTYDFQFITTQVIANVSSIPLRASAVMQIK